MYFKSPLKWAAMISETKCVDWVRQDSHARQARCPGFNSQQLPAFSLISIFALKHLASLIACS